MVQVRLVGTHFENSDIYQALEKIVEVSTAKEYERREGKCALYFNINTSAKDFRAMISTLNVSQTSSQPFNGNGQITVTAPGVYELPTGEIYIVKPNKEKTRLYAKRLVEAPSERLTETGQVVDFDFEYEKGAIFRIHPEHQMSFERAKELMIRYGKCIVCGRRLKRAESVERGIGPVCIKYFRGTPTEEQEQM
jgi:hypothetical protein